ncbi:MAG: fluoride efflux transporter CrcB [Actinobacteria bacterium]|uniref:Unannotated protein n=1 Tax=freshwater metagenome TaxID=449393 RepID=A0A6J6QN82_9ZZZZ|nr:fluoride efflux transporter CrcB [Actinomycetota bacterium]
MTRTLLAVAVGGALGAVARWGITEAWPSGADGFPWSTFAINVAGSFLLAVVVGWVAVKQRPLLLAALGPGVLGGFTTLSAVSEQTRALADGGHVTTAATYAVATLGAALLAVELGRRVVGR